MIHKKGKEHIVPDMLSRSVPNVDVLCMNNKIDRWYIEMSQKIRKDLFKFPLWKVDGSKLYKYVSFKQIPGLDFPSEWKLVIPKFDRKQILQKNHDDPCAEHSGVFKTYKRISQNFYWPKMKSDISSYIRKCIICSVNKPEQRKPAGLMVSYRVLDKPFQVVSCDLIGLLPRSSQGYKFILVIIDHFCKFPWIIPLRNAASKLVCSAIKNNVFLLFCQLKVLTLDYGSQFMSKVFRSLILSYGIKQVFTPNYHPQANITEGQHKTLKTMIRCYIKSDHTIRD